MLTGSPESTGCHTQGEVREGRSECLRQQRRHRKDVQWPPQMVLEIRMFCLRTPQSHRHPCDAFKVARRKGRGNTGRRDVPVHEVCKSDDRRKKPEGRRLEGDLRAGPGQTTSSGRRGRVGLAGSRGWGGSEAVQSGGARKAGIQKREWMESEEIM